MKADLRTGYYFLSSKQYLSDMPLVAWGTDGVEENEGDFVFFWNRIDHSGNIAHGGVEIASELEQRGIVATPVEINHPDDEKILLLFRIADEAKDNSDYDVANVCFALLSSYRGNDKIKIIYENANLYSDSHYDATYFDLIGIEYKDKYEDKYTCIPIPLLKRDIAIMMSLKSKVIPKKCHCRDKKEYNGSKREKHISEILSVFDSEIVNDHMVAVLENPPIDKDGFLFPVRREEPKKEVW
jgi:hypothetical protein